MSKSALKTRGLIQSFEEGTIQQNGQPVSKEKIESEPGITKKIVNDIEDHAPEGSYPTEEIESIPGVIKERLERFESMTESEKEQSTVTRRSVGQTEVKVTGPSSPLNVLIVHAHEEPDSLNASITRTTREELEAEGHKVTVSDLYAMKFNPVMSRDDIKDVKVEGRFSYLAAMEEAYDEGRLADDIRTEQDKIRAADLLILQYPMSWGAMPAILHGYVQRVFSAGFAYVSNTAEIFDNSPLKGKKALLSITTAGLTSGYSTSGLLGDINVHLWPVQNTTLRFCGFDILAPHLVHGALHISEKDGQTMLENWRRRLATIDREPCVDFLSLDQFDLATMTVKDEVVKALNDGSDGPRRGFTVGQTLGEPAPEHSMTKPRRMPQIPKVKDTAETTEPEPAQ